AQPILTTISPAVLAFAAQVQGKPAPQALTGPCLLCNPECYLGEQMSRARSVDRRTRMAGSVAGRGRPLHVRAFGFSALGALGATHPHHLRSRVGLLAHAGVGPIL